MIKNLFLNYFANPNDIVDTNKSDLPSSEELFEMYGGNAKKSKSYDPYEEEPIFVSSEKKPSFDIDSFKNSPSSSVNKVVKSQFFSLGSVPSSKESSSGYFSSPSSTNNSINEDFLSNSLASDSSIHVLTSPAEPERDANLLDEFAKKKPTEVSPVLSEDKDKDIPKTPNDKKASVLDIFSSESTIATSTISSMQKSAKILSQTAEVSVVKLKPRNLFCKKNKLITTKIEDYKWTKEESPPKATEADKSCQKSIEDSPKTDSVEKSPLKEISPYFLNISDNQKLSDASQDDSVITILSETVMILILLKENPHPILMLRRIQNIPV
nr:putative protein TPRXL [Parasteatoda tepidariorum]